ncbi:MAG: Uma2 family endonuclease [Symploca sp. SIO2G7]|nr:Uma2 family endonuclease [Symploca sp. SIO2G7]
MCRKLVHSCRVNLIYRASTALVLGQKFSDYQKIASLEEYVLIFQESQRLECRRRTSANTWETVVYEIGELVLLKSINLEFAIAYGTSVADRSTVSRS